MAEPTAEEQRKVTLAIRTLSDFHAKYGKGLVMSAFCPNPADGAAGGSVFVTDNPEWIEFILSKICPSLSPSKAN
jgi:hypothetical protein